MLEDRKTDMAGLGNIGQLSQAIEDEYIFWNIVVSLRLSPSEVDTWTLEEIKKVSAVLDMQQDYKSAWKKYFDAVRS